MGWTGHMIDRSFTAQDAREKIDREFTWESEVEGVKYYCRPIAHAVKGSVHYLAIERYAPYTGERKVWACVVLTQIDRRKGWFYEKTVDETMGPCERNCPAKILDLLTPTDREWAIEWRNDCRKNLEAKKTRQEVGKLPMGTRFVLNGKPEYTFRVDTYRGKRAYIDWAKMTKVSAANANRIGFTVLAEQTQAVPA